MARLPDIDVTNAIPVRVVGDYLAAALPTAAVELDPRPPAVLDAAATHFGDSL